MKKNILIFGATGSIGKYIYEKISKLEKCNKIYGTSSKKNNQSFLYVSNNELDNLNTIEKLDIIIWTQGYNFSDNIFSFNENEFNNIMEINVIFIIKTLNYLLINNKINENSKMVIISSIWEKFTKENKLSYTISKSCLGGLVKSLSYDLSEKKILINNILPGVIYNDMTKKNLSENQIENIKNHTNFDRMVNYDDIYSLIKYLTFDNTGITGESIIVDLGFTKTIKI